MKSLAFSCFLIYTKDGTQRVPVPGLIYNPDRRRGNRGIGGKGPGPRVCERQSPGQDLAVTAPACVANTRHAACLLRREVSWDARVGSDTPEAGTRWGGYLGCLGSVCRNTAPDTSAQTDLGAGTGSEGSSSPGASPPQEEEHPKLSQGRETGARPVTARPGADGPARARLAAAGSLAPCVEAELRKSHG